MARKSLDDLPQQSAKPNYFTLQPDRATVRHYGDLVYASGHTDLSAIETSNSGTAASHDGRNA